MTDHTMAFQGAMAAVGLRTDDPIIDDGKLHRFHVAGDKPRTRNGWYVLHTDGIPAGAYGSWKHDVSGTWCGKAENDLTAAERIDYRRRMDQMRQQREQELEQVRQEARDKAARIWDTSTPANDNHPYLARKQVRAFGLRESRGSLVVPVLSPDGQIQSLQFIDADGNKLFLKGGLKRGCYFKIGGRPTDRVIVAEGYATGASLHMAHGCPVAVAFDAGNLEPVSRAIRERLPEHVAIEIWADNDLHTKGNPGVAKATKAAEAVGAKVVVPDIAGDWNDVAVADGIDAVREVVVANDNQPADPIDLFAEFPVPPMRREMLPQVIADYAFDQAELIGVEPGMIAIPSLVACAAALHDGVQLQVKRHEDGWRESARLWCAVVGNPSIKKSPSIKKATSRLRKIDADLHDGNEREMARHMADLDAYKEAKKDAKKTGEVVGNPPEAPRRLRVVVEDVTVEALSEVLKDNPRGVLCIQDELSGWFGAMDAYNGSKGGGKDRAHWLEAYNGNSRTVDRVMRGTIRIPNWSACMIGGIQPDAIRRIAQHMTDDGLMQRFMVVVGGNAEEHDRPADTAAVNAYRSLVDHLYAVQPADEPVRMTEEAHQIREGINRYAMELANYPAMPGGLKSHLGKWSGLFARLCLLFHAIECHQGAKHPTAALVTGETAAKVDLLMRKFLLPHAMAYYTDILGTATELEHARWIAGHILAKGLQSITLRDILQSYKQWRGLDDWRRVRIMQTLEDMGWLVSLDDDRRTKSWAVTSSVHTKFSEKAAQEAETRARIRDELNAMREGS